MSYQPRTTPRAARINADRMFTQFKKNIFDKLLKAVKDSGDRIELHGKQVTLSFPNPEGMHDFLGDVTAIALLIHKNSPDTVHLLYCIPSINDTVRTADRYDCPVDVLSTDELYSVLKAL